MSTPQQQQQTVVNTMKPYKYGFIRQIVLAITCISLAGTSLCILTFMFLSFYQASRINIPLVKITMAIQAINTISLIITIILSAVFITDQVLCSTLRYVLYTCYLCSIFMCTAVTVHLWLVIARKNLKKAQRLQRWYYIVPFTLALSLSALLGVIPNSAYQIKNRCFGTRIPSSSYLGIRWALYYAWFIMASIISFICMISVLISARRLTLPTQSTNNTVSAYRNQVNARANSKRLRSLVIYTVAYPVINFVCNFPILIEELLSTVLKKDLKKFTFISNLILVSQGIFFALAFFCYPAVRHSFRDITHSSIQYWVCEQEEYWETRNKGQNVLPVEERDVRNFTSWRGKIWHFILTRTPEGRLLSNL